MLYLIHGTNVKKIQEQTQNIVESLKAKREFAQVFHVHADAFSLEDFEGLTSSQGLFFDKHVLVCRGLLQAKKDIKDYILKHIQKYIDSPHIYLFVEEDLDQKTVDVVTKYEGVKVKEYAGGGYVEKEDMSKRAFPVVQTYAELLSIPKQKRTPVQKYRAWQAVDSIRVLNVPPEEFFGVLWWKYKTIVQALDVSQKESGLTPYSYTQAKKLADGYGSRVHADLGILLDMYHESHMGECDMWEELEALVLK
jgi:predicted RNA-binding protein with EMAP domain